ncbi:MAG: penicillin-binding transpeptidase domain-containing protein, partial [Micrococcales bacterium]|nr:penicillin-binding transpeptidase domain-containing protein [Micrococcales bacterium]
MKLRRVVAPIGLALGLLLSACTPSVPKLPDATPVAQALASALVSGDFGGVTFTWPADAVTKEYGVVVAGMDGVRPASVQVGDITYQTTPQAATVELNQTYDFGEQWNFLSVANLQLVDGNWQVIWQPSIIQPALDGNTRLSITVTPATRGEILADDGSAIVWNRPVYNVGIDKTRVSADQAVTSARQLAQVVGIDPDAYAQKVSSSGPKAFVIAITLREGQVPTAVAGIPGTLTQAATMSLGPDKTFAIGLLGTAGDVTAEDIQNSGGKLQAGEVVGKSGLQASQDAALRGTDGVTVYIAPRAAGDVMAAPSSVRPTATPITSKQPLFQVKPQNGASLSTTLDVALQTKAEAILAGQSEIASMVVLNSQTGALLVAANSPAAGANSYATTGRYPPGSTFKVSTALALMRTGMTPDSTIDCPTSVTVSGRQFSNLDGYATSHNGTITLRQAVAWSCNTAMVNGSKTLQAGDLGAAAASLGIGIDHNVGFPAYFGSVPLPAADVDKAADAFGQGDVLASPLA